MKRQTSQIEKRQQEHLDDIVDNDGDTLISKASLNLSFNDRTMIEEEMHGASCMAIDETPELIEESLYQFDLELDLIENKVACNKAQELITSKEDPLTHSYLFSKANKLRFLRSELFDPSKSALRFTKYLDLLFDIYGECALRRPIRLQDFNREELSFFKSGQYQLLPYRDRGGRRIMANVANNKDHVPTRVLLKVFLYLWFVCVGGSDTSNNDRNNVETQRKGIIIVDFPSGQDVHNSNEDDEKNNDELENDNKKPNFSLAQWATHRLEANAIIAEVIPLRIAAMHVCLPNSPILQSLASNYGIALKALNARTKMHSGNPIEIRYELQQYGIPIELIPSTDTGNIKSVNFKQWIKLRTHLEREEQTHMINININTNNIIVECPLSNDVIFRRGKTMNFHSGNVNFQNLIESRIYEHSIDLNTPPLRRTEIEIEVFNEVLKPVKNYGCYGDSGRFLTWDIKKQWWLVISSDNEIQKKIHYAFRDFRKKMLKTQQHQQEQKIQQKQHKIRTLTTLNSLFERQDGPKKIRYNDNNNDNNNDDDNNNSISSSISSSSSESGDDNNNGCIIMPFLPLSYNGNDSNTCGYFFSTDDGSYTYLDEVY